MTSAQQPRRDLAPFILDLFCYDNVVVFFSLERSAILRGSLSASVRSLLTSSNCTFYLAKIQGASA